MTIRRKIFNPLNHIQVNAPSVKSVTSSDLEIKPFGKEEIDTAMISQSAFFNDIIGVCPKCQNPMATSIIANNDTVFFCTKDRVVLPRPDSAVV
jgi:hypothetical protein